MPNIGSNELRHCIWEVVYSTKCDKWSDTLGGNIWNPIYEKYYFLIWNSVKWSLRMRRRGPMLFNRAYQQLAVVYYTKKMSVETNWTETFEIQLIENIIF